MTKTSSAGEWLEQAWRRLAGCTDNPGLEAQVLLAHGLSRPRAWVLGHPDLALSESQIDLLETLLAKLQQGEPLPYLIGHWEFFGLDFTVNEHVLIPRPETELLVEQALSWSKAQSRPLLAADVGTGSGCIAVSLASHAPNIRIIASDISRAALQVAAGNCARNGVQGRVALVQADLLEACGEPFDLVCANLPYIPSQVLDGLEVGHHEPRLALDGGPAGLDLIGKLLEQACGRMKPGGLLALEIEAGQAESGSRLARRAFRRGRIQVLPDLAGKARLLKIELDEKA